jgi:hypothetical protein
VREPDDVLMATVSIVNRADNEGKRAPQFQIHPRFAYASKEIHERSISFVNDREVVFPIGRHLWKFDVKTRAMEFFARRSHPVMPVLAVSKNMLRLAVCEEVAAGSKKPAITLLNLATTPPEASWKFTHVQAGITILLQ